MLGRSIRDPGRVESSSAEVAGLGLLAVDSTFEPVKATFQARARVEVDAGWLAALADRDVAGYEIHMGRTWGRRPWLRIVDRNAETADVPDGAMSDDGRVWGCYLHGLFANPALRRAWLGSLNAATDRALRPAISLDVSLDRLADAVEAALDMCQLEAMIR
jgi:adenosylcobyric acid synthase